MTKSNAIFIRSTTYSLAILTFKEKLKLLNSTEFSNLTFFCLIIFLANLNYYLDNKPKLFQNSLNGEKIKNILPFQKRKKSSH